MFGFAAAEVSSEEVGIFLQQKLVTLRPEDLTQQIVKTWLDTVEAELCAKPGIASLTGPREITCVWAGRSPLNITTLSVVDEISARLTCRLKQRVVGGHLPPFAPDAALLPATGEAFAKRAVDQVVVKSGASLAWHGTTF